MSRFAETRLIGFWELLPFLLLAPVTALVYSVYALGFWFERRGYTENWWLLITGPYLAIFALLNTLHNWTVCTVLFREWPREFFTTTRLKRHKKNAIHWRREMADMIGGFLDSQDPDHY